MVRHLVKVVSLLLIFVAYPSAAHAFMYQCESVGITFSEFRVKNLPQDGFSSLCRISAVIRLINCTGEIQKVNVEIQGVDSQGFERDSFRMDTDELGGYSQEKISDTSIIECKVLRKIQRWKVKVSSY